MSGSGKFDNEIMISFLCFKKCNIHIQVEKQLNIDEYGISVL